MAKFIITEEFWEVFPQAEIAVVLAKGITNQESAVAGKRQEINDLLEKSSQTARQYLQAEYADTALKHIIAPITDRVRQRLEALLQGNAA